MRVAVNKIEKLDERIAAVARSTRTTIPFFLPLHNWLRLRFGWYYNWHINQVAPLVHQIVLVSVLIITGTLIIALLGGGLIFGVFYALQ